VTNIASRVIAASIIAAGLAAAQTAPAPAAGAALAQKQAVPVAMELQPDANRTREELNSLFERHAPSLRRILALDPTLLSNPAYLAPYPALAAYLDAHPDIARNPAYYLGSPDGDWNRSRDPHEREIDLLSEILGGSAAFLAFGIAIGLITWLIRTLIDYRRWSRLSKVQVEVHTKLLDRFSSNEDLMTYIQSPAGAKFLESSPIKLDPGPRALGAPLGRILWSLQGGVVLLCAGLGLWFISGQVTAEASRAIQSFGVLAFALGAGFIASAIISYGVARRLGLIDPASHAQSAGQPGV
jgi:hypothetical protein